MKDEIKAKLDEHIRDLLAQSHISNEDYALLREKFFELPAKSNQAWDMMWIPLLMMIFSNGFGGAKE